MSGNQDKEQNEHSTQECISQAAKALHRLLDMTAERVAKRLVEEHRAKARPSKPRDRQTQQDA